MPHEQFCENTQLHHHFNGCISLCFIDINILLPSIRHLVCFYFGKLNTTRLLSYDYIIELNLEK